MVCVCVCVCVCVHVCVCVCVCVRVQKALKCKPSAQLHCMLQQPAQMMQALLFLVHSSLGYSQEVVICLVLHVSGSGYACIRSLARGCGFARLAYRRAIRARDCSRRLRVTEDYDANVTLREEMPEERKEVETNKMGKGRGEEGDEKS